MMRSKRAGYLKRVFVSLTSVLALASALDGNAAHASQRASAGSSTLSGGEWAVDPTTAGDNVPSVGRSLFDFLVVRKQGERKVYDVPFPFTALVKRLESELQPDESRGASV